LCKNRQRQCAEQNHCRDSRDAFSRHKQLLSNQPGHYIFPDGMARRPPLPFTISMAGTIEGVTLSQSEVSRVAGKNAWRRKPLISPLESRAV
jgi:hypothetical protein